ncbi:oligosaccharide flippase family protein, partial [Vibrio navarrensis]|uniref:oligosaccharide flippase family protein n=1 Tax=Vibrio navarrensis TaxID=29495 RepID=UPI001866316D
MWATLFLKKMIKNVSWQMISNILIMVIGIAQVSILTRYFTASEFGILAIATVIIQITQVFSDCGMSNYLMYKREQDNKINATVFWSSFISGMLIFILIFLVGFIYKSFGENVELAVLVIISSFCFIPLSLASTFQANFVKEFRLVILAKIELLSRILSFLFILLLLKLKFGIEVVIYSSIAQHSLKFLFLLAFSKAYYRPSLKFDVEIFKDAFKYGAYQVGSQLINKFRMNADLIILNLFVSQSSLGLYSLAKQLVTKPAALITPIIQRITLPEISKTIELKVDVSNVLKKNHLICCFLLSFPYIYACFYSKEIVSIIYHNSVIDSYLYLIPLSIFWMLRYCCGGIVGSYVQANGKTKLDFKWNMLTLCLNLGVVLLGAKQGIIFVCWLQVILQLILLPFIYMFFFKNVKKFTLFEFAFIITINITFAILAVSLSKEIPKDVIEGIGSVYYVIITT